MWNPNSSAGESRKDVSISDSQKNLTLSNSENSDKTSHPHHPQIGGDKFAVEQSCDIDSGFLSGPQQSGFDDSEYGIAASSDSQDSLQQQQGSGRPPFVKQETIVEVKSSSFVDSGCIEVDVTDDADIAASTSENPVKNPKPATHMHLENQLDSGLSEWFCNMSLRNSNNLACPDGQTVRTAAKNRQTVNIPDDCRNKQPWELYYRQNDDGDTQLHIACITGYMEIVAALIRLAPHPCLLNIQNDEAQVALHLAVMTKQPDIVRMLLVAGAEPSMRDRNGNTPLHLACMTGYMDCVEALTKPITAIEINENKNLLTKNDKSTLRRCIQLPPDLEQRNYDGEHCVHVAAQNSRIDVIRHLVGFGADINAREGRSGKTPLHIAIEACNEVLVNFLLGERNVDIEAETYAGLTAYQLAAANHHQHIANGLEEHGAEPLTPPQSDIESDDDSDSQSYTHFGDPGYFVNYNGAKTINVA